MEALWYVLLVMVVPGIALWIGVLIVQSVRSGIQLYRDTVKQLGPNPRARQILAWNLIEPGLTSINILILTLLREPFGFYLYPFRDAWLGGFGSSTSERNFILTRSFTLAIWPMILLFIIIPWRNRHSTDLAVRWAQAKTSKLGIARLIVTALTYWSEGIGLLIGIPLILWSVKSVKRWNTILLTNRHLDQWSSMAITGTEGGMAVVRVSPETASSTHIIAVIEPPDHSKSSSQH